MDAVIPMKYIHICHGVITFGCRSVCDMDDAMPMKYTFLCRDVYDMDAMMPPPGLGSSWTILENLTSIGSVDSKSEGDSVRIIVEPAGTTIN